MLLINHAAIATERSRYAELLTIFIIISLFSASACRASDRTPDVGFEGQASAWHAESGIDGARSHLTGIRYIPDLDLTWALSGNRTAGLEISVDLFAQAGSPAPRRDTDAGLYRLKLRYAGQQGEIRAGLQLINFGPARILRALRWFDRLDPRDPLRISEGVYGVRFRYDTMDNSSLWLWTLIGNTDRKGIDILPTTHGEPEFGGRYQHPVAGGEMAFTAHTRMADLPAAGLAPIRENRFALDGHWDIKVGAWFECVFQNDRQTFLPLRWTKLITAGVDYTLPAGNGIYVMLEHMVTAVSEKAFTWDDDVNVSAMMITYPATVLDSFSAIGFYSYDREELSVYFSWQRTWDDFFLNLALFTYPDYPSGSILPGMEGIEGGTGAQLTLVFNH